MSCHYVSDVKYVLLCPNLVLLNTLEVNFFVSLQNQESHMICVDLVYDYNVEKIV